MKKKSRLVRVLLISGMFCTLGQHYYANAATEVGVSITQQTGKVTGTISDDLGPLAGAAVSIEGTTTGTITDIDGNFSLEVSPGSTIVISYIGFITQKIAYTGQSTLDIRLVEDSQTLEQVVVTAMGIKKEKRALSYAMSELKGDDIQLVPVQNVATSLYGKAAGVQIAQTAAGPTGGTKIQIRGVNTIEGNTRPLIVLDGIPINDTDSGWAGRERDQTQPGSALNDINPDDIESMSILKGANAAALYGSRATNGVIVITTKRGGSKQGLGINVSTSYMFNQRAYLPEYQNVFGGGTSPQFSVNSNGDKVYTGSTHMSFGPRMDGTEVIWWDGVKRPFSPQKNNYRDLFKDGYTNNNSVSITNASDKTSFRLSYTNMNYGGYLPNFKQQKHNFNFSGNYELSSWFTIDASVAFNISDTKNKPTRIDRISNYPMPRNEIASLYKQNYKNEDGYFLTDNASSLGSGIRDNIMSYLLWEQNENNYKTTRNRLIGSIAANIKVYDDLSIRVKGGTDRYWDKDEHKEMFRRYSDPADMDNLQGKYYLKDYNYTKNYGEILAMFNRNLTSELELSVNAGVSAEDISESFVQWESHGLKYNGMFSTNNNKRDPKSASRDKAENKGEFMSAVFGSAQLSYKRFLYLEMTARNDWSSRLAKGNRSFFYPSIGTGFVFTDAFKLPDWLNYGKARASYAIVGNTTPSLYFTQKEYNYNSFNGSAILNNFGTSVPPTNIVPEKTYSWEFGLEGRMLNHRLGFDLAYFTNRTKNQIVSVPITVSSGAVNMRANAGEIKNYGIELQITGTPIETKDFNWDATLNFSYTHNELVSLMEGLDDREIGSPWSAAIFKAVPGKATPSLYVRKWQRDDNGNRLVDDNGYFILNSQYEYAGSAAPKVLGGFTNTFRYRDFSFTMHMDGQFGGKILSFTNQYLKGTGAGKESLFGRDESYGGLPYYVNDSNQKVLLSDHNSTAPNGSTVYHDGIIADGVKADGSKNDVILSAYQYYTRTHNSNYASEDILFKNTYVKMREMKLSYRVPSSITSKIGFNNLNVSLVGQNLFFIYKKVPNINPEATLGTSGTGAYVEYTSYPSDRSFGFSLNASF